MGALKYLVIPLALLPLLAAGNAGSIILNPNFDYTPENHAERGPNHVEVNQTNCAPWKRPENPGVIGLIAAEVKGGLFNLPNYSTVLQIQTDHGMSDLYQEIVISKSGAYVLSMEALLRNDNINTDGKVVLELWRGSVKNFTKGGPIAPDSAITPDLTADPQTLSYSFKFLPAGVYTVRVGGINNKHQQMYQAGIVNVKLKLLRAMTRPSDPDLQVEI